MRFVPFGAFSGVFATTVFTLSFAVASRGQSEPLGIIKKAENCRENLKPDIGSQVRRTSKRHPEYW
jgi:hypothetical protein